MSAAHSLRRAVYPETEEALISVSIYQATLASRLRDELGEALEMLAQVRHGFGLDVPQKERLEEMQMFYKRSRTDR